MDLHAAFFANELWVLSRKRSKIVLVLRIPTPGLTLSSSGYWPGNPIDIYQRECREFLKQVCFTGHHTWQISGCRAVGLAGRPADQTRWDLNAVSALPTTPTNNFALHG